MVTHQQSAEALREELQVWIDREVERLGTSEAVDMGHRVEFHWPPRPVSLDYHVHGDQFVDAVIADFDGEPFTVRFAHTSQGVFGRVERLWHEAKGESRAAVLTSLRNAAQPLFSRQRQIATLLGMPGRYCGSISELKPLDLIKLLFAANRDIGREAAVVIETHASTHLFGPCLIEILKNRTHPYRRAAHWQVLDLFEDLPSFCGTVDVQREAVLAVRNLILDATDDICRAIYKAGVVLGGHICTEDAAAALLECFDSSDRIGRRAAYHASFHLAEWLPAWRDRIVTKLQLAAESDPEPTLVIYCRHMARDVANEDIDHVADPVFEDERSAID